MESILQPPRLDLDPQSGEAHDAFEHWLACFESYLTEIRVTDPATMHRVLLSRISPRAYSMIGDQSDYQGALNALKRQYLRPVNTVYARYHLARWAQWDGASDQTLFKTNKTTGVQMEKSRTCLKYLMFLSNSLIFVGGICLLGVGIWVTTNPNGFKNIVATNPLIYTGAYIILSVGVILFFLGFLGCWGAVRESKQLLMTFLLLILIIFILELIAAVLALVFRKQIRKDYFLKELQMKYKGDNSTDVFSKTWNVIMVDFSCCGVNGPRDFGQNSTFYQLFPSRLLPEACCKRNNTSPVEHILDRGKCVQGDAGYINNKGCFSMIAENFRNYVHLVGAFSIIVLLIELCAMAFAIFIYQTYN